MHVWPCIVQPAVGGYVCEEMVQILFMEINAPIEHATLILKQQHRIQTVAAAVKLGQTLLR